MKTAKLIELQRQRAGLVQDARELLEEIRDDDGKREAELGRKHASLMAELDLLDLDIDEERAATEEESNASMRPDMGGTEARGQDIGSSSGPRDFEEWSTRSGEVIPVLSRDQRIAKRKPNGPSVGDMARAMLLGPRNDTERRALAEGTDSAGGYTVPTELASWFIDRLRAKAVCFQAGALTVPMTSDNLTIARLATDPTVTWTTENAEITASDPTFEAVTLAPKKLTALVKVSTELLEDSVNIAQMLEAAFIGAMATEMDRALLFGSGSGSEPTGLFGISGINSVSMGTDGAVPQGYDELLDCVYEIELDNGAMPTAQIFHPRTARTFRKQKSGDGLPLSHPEPLASMQKFITTAVPINQTQGTSSVASTLLMGDFRQMLVGVRTNMELRRLNERYAEFDQVGFLARLRVDVAVTNPKHFCKLIGITA